jgi:hypothetical protein
VEQASVDAIRLVEKERQDSDRGGTGYRIDTTLDSSVESPKEVAAEN